MSIRTNCRHFVTDRPCTPHKEHDVKCDKCPYYESIQTRVLLIKLGAMGDVLRTTALIPTIREARPGVQLTWLVGDRSREVLEGIETIDRLWTLDVPSLAQLQVEQFDWVINLDLSPESLALAATARGKEKSGFSLATDGSVIAHSPSSEEYLEMSYWDDIKKQNTKTYQRLMLDIIGSNAEPGKILVNLTDSDREYAKQFASNHKIVSGHPVIGLNLGAAGRWRWKRWTPEGYLTLARRLYEAMRAQILVLSGPSEEQLKADWIAACDVPVIDAGHDNTFARFSALVNLCDLIVTGDTLALHLALGLGKKVVAMFGPTSISEVDLYGRGVALAGDVPCLCCYRSDCDVRPSCMQRLEPESVLKAVEQMLDTGQSL